jgi:hypothetical protein
MIAVIFVLGVLVAMSVFAIAGVIGLGVWLAVGAAALAFGFWWVHTWDERDSARDLRARKELR